jgi:hypothetical protein
VTGDMPRPVGLSGISRRAMTEAVPKQRPVKEAARADGMRGLVDRALRLLPREMRLRAIRRRIELELDIPAELEFRIARTKAELEQSFALLHDAYVDARLMAPHPSGLRTTVYHALPSTTTLVACWGEEVVGTLSVIRDSLFGIPMEKEFDVSELRMRDLRFCEVSSLAIARRFRRKGRLLFPMVKYLMRYTREYFGINRQLLVTHPRDADLYGAVAMARRFSDRLVAHYGFANGAPAVASIIDLDEFPRDLRAAFAGAPPERNYHRYVYEVEHAHFKMPGRAFHTISDPVMTPALLDHFFNRRTDTFARLSSREKLAFRACYPFEEYDAVLPIVERQRALVGPASRHYEVSCPATVSLAGGSDEPPMRGEIRDVSATALRVNLGVRVPERARLHIRAEVGRGLAAEAIGVVARSQPNRSHHLSVEESDAAWSAWIARLEESVRLRG